MKRGLFIICRTASTRFPDKALAVVAGRPALEHVIERARTTPGIDVVALCTSVQSEDDRLESIAQRCGIPTFRGPLHDVLERLRGAAETFDVEMFAVWTADNLFCEPALVSRGLDQMKQEGLDFLNLPGGLIPGSAAYCISTDALLRACKTKTSTDTSYFPSFFTESGEYKVSNLRVDDKTFYYPKIRITFDYPEDLHFIERVFDALKTHHNDVPLRDIVKMVERKPELANINFFRSKDWADHQARQRKPKPA